MNVVSWRFYFYFGLKYYHGISGILTCIWGNRYYSEYECKCLNAILVVKFRNLNSIFFWGKEKIDITQVRKLCELRYGTTHVQVMSMELRKDDKTFPRVTAITILFKNEMYILNI